MPGRDGTGPKGQGPRTGRGRGRCRRGRPAADAGDPVLEDPGPDSGTGLSAVLVTAVVDGVVKLLSNALTQRRTASPRQLPSSERRTLPEHRDAN